MEQMTENIKTFSEDKPLTDSELDALLNIAEDMKDSIPCTACRYCTDTCPKKLDIPMLIAAYNDIRFDAQVNVAMRLDALPDDKRPNACIACGMCSKICPQKIDIPGAMKDLSQRIEKLPSWADICIQRAKEARDLK